MDQAVPKGLGNAFRKKDAEGLQHHGQLKQAIEHMASQQGAYCAKQQHADHIVVIQAPLDCLLAGENAADKHPDQGHDGINGNGFSEKFHRRDHIDSFLSKKKMLYARGI